MEEEDWLTPAKAARLASELAGYEITQDDLRHQKALGKLPAWEINSQLCLYSKSNLLKLDLSFKRVRREVVLEQEINDLRELRSLENEISSLDTKRRKNRTKRANGPEETLA